MTVEKAQIETMLTAMFGSLNSSLTKNYPAKMYLGSMINQAEWMKNRKANDAAEKVEEVRSMTSDVIANESAEDGRVVHNPSGTAAIGSRNYSQHTVDNLIWKAERDEQESEQHADNETALKAIYKAIFKEVYTPRNKTSSTKSVNVNDWLAKRAS